MGARPLVGSTPNLIPNSFVSPFVGSPTVSERVISSGNSLELSNRGTEFVSLRSIPFILPPQSEFRISFDLLTENLVNSRYNFTLRFSTPTVRNLSFNGFSNQISVYDGVQQAQSLLPIFADDFYHVVNVINLENETWRIELNGDVVYDDSFEASSFTSITFSTSPSVAGFNSSDFSAYVDNIDVSIVSVPEPGVVAFSLVTLLFFLRRRRL